MIMTQLAAVISERLHNHACDPGLAEIERARTVEQAVHGHKGVSMARRGREHAARRKAAMQAPREKRGLAGRIQVRQAAKVKGGCQEYVLLLR